ncbi:ATP-dependent DNA helicase chl1 [Blastocladiella emersonii ATCC 22665]|nr:ATP-dependent DNA helicase chl1 [Blastocladiella emersonii ATCC 22665]
MAAIMKAARGAPKLAAPAAGTAKASELMHVDAFIFALEVDHINLFKLATFLRDSQLPRKLLGFVEKHEAPPAGATAGDTDTMSRHIWPLAVFERLLTKLIAPDTDGRVLHLAPAGSGPPTLKYLALNPAGHFADIVRDAHALVFAGGTMQPGSDFTDFLIPDTFGKPLEMYSCGHVIPRENLAALVVPRSLAGRTIRFTLEGRKDPQLLPDVCQTICNLVNVVPRGMVVFLPSFQLLDEMAKAFREQGYAARIERKKRIFTEPREAVDLERVLREYAQHIDESPTSGALLLSVVGGKLSEGINFSGPLARCVVMVGIPYPNLGSAELQEKLKYIDGLRAGASKEFYENLAMRAVNQSIGRAIRNRMDYAAVVLVDVRYEGAAVRRKLPAWIAETMAPPDPGRPFGHAVQTIARAAAECAVEGACGDREVVAIEGVAAGAEVARGETISVEAIMHGKGPVQAASTEGATEGACGGESIAVVADVVKETIPGKVVVLAKPVGSELLVESSADESVIQGATEGASAAAVAKAGEVAHSNVAVAEAGEVACSNVAVAEAGEAAVVVNVVGKESCVTAAVTTEGVSDDDRKVGTIIVKAPAGETGTVAATIMGSCSSTIAAPAERAAADECSGDTAVVSKAVREEVVAAKVALAEPVAREADGEILAKTSVNEAAAKAAIKESSCGTSTGTGTATEWTANNCSDGTAVVVQGSASTVSVAVKVASTTAILAEPSEIARTRASAPETNVKGSTSGSILQGATSSRGKVLEPLGTASYAAASGAIKGANGDDKIVKVLSDEELVAGRRTAAHSGIELVITKGASAVATAAAESKPVLLTKPVAVSVPVPVPAARMSPHAVTEPTAAKDATEVQHLEQQEQAEKVTFRTADVAVRDSGILVLTPASSMTVERASCTAQQHQPGRVLEAVCGTVATTAGPAVGSAAEQLELLPNGAMERIVDAGIAAHTGSSSGGITNAGVNVVQLVVLTRQVIQEPKEHGPTTVATDTAAAVELLLRSTDQREAARSLEAANNIAAATAAAKFEHTELSGQPVAFDKSSVKRVEAAQAKSDMGTHGGGHAVGKVGKLAHVVAARGAAQPHCEIKAQGAKPAGITRQPDDGAVAAAPTPGAGAAGVGRSPAAKSSSSSSPPPPGLGGKHGRKEKTRWPKLPKLPWPATRNDATRAHDPTSARRASTGSPPSSPLSTETVTQHAQKPATPATPATPAPAGKYAESAAVSEPVTGLAGRTRRAAAKVLGSIKKLQQKQQQQRQSRSPSRGRVGDDLPRGEGHDALGSVGPISAGATAAATGTTSTGATTSVHVSAATPAARPAPRRALPRMLAQLGKDVEIETALDVMATHHDFLARRTRELAASNRSTRPSADVEREREDATMGSKRATLQGDPAWLKTFLVALEEEVPTSMLDFLGIWVQARATPLLTEEQAARLCEVASQHPEAWQHHAHALKTRQLLPTDPAFRLAFSLGGAQDPTDPALVALDCDLLAVFQKFDDWSSREALGHYLDYLHQLAEHLIIDKSQQYSGNRTVQGPPAQVLVNICAVAAHHLACGKPFDPPATDDGKTMDTLDWSRLTLETQSLLQLMLVLLGFIERLGQRYLAGAGPV